MIVSEIGSKAGELDSGILLIEFHYGDGFSDVVVPGFSAGDAVEAREVAGWEEEVDGGGNGAINFVLGRKVGSGEMNGVVAEGLGVEATFRVWLQIQLRSDL